MKINKITEQNNSSTKNIDQKSINEILISMNNEDQLIADQVKKSIPDISIFIDEVIYDLIDISIDLAKGTIDIGKRKIKKFKFCCF